MAWVVQRSQLFYLQGYLKPSRNDPDDRQRYKATMDELQFLRLIKVLLSSPEEEEAEFLSSDTSSASSSLSSSSCRVVLQQKNINELLKSQSFLEFLESKEEDATSEAFAATLQIKDLPLGSEWSFWNSSYDRNCTKGLQKTKYLHYLHKTYSFTTFGSFVSAWQQTVSTCTSTGTFCFLYLWGLHRM